MPRRLALVALPFAAALIAAVPARGFAACDTVANAFDLSRVRALIDDACPCAAAAKPSHHVRCAKPIVAADIEAGGLDKTCKSEALSHAKKSICGRPGAAVCCRVKTTGKTAHKIVKTPSKCVSTSTITACTSGFPSVPTGCDASGCVATDCGNGIVEPGEACDPPQDGFCDASCQLVPCDPPVTSCGNGTIDGGETCEPPGVGACDWSCQAATCAAVGPGAIDVACAEPNASVGAGARGSEYLLAWNDLAGRPDRDIIGRRFDADGLPVDPTATVVSAGVPCGGDESLPAIGSDAARWVVAWFNLGPSPATAIYAAYARSYEAGGTLGDLDELLSRMPFGMCQSWLSGPMTVAPVPLAGTTTFASLWQDRAACFSGPTLQDPAGTLLDYGVSPPARTALTIGYDVGGPLPQPVSASAASLATLGTDTLAVWHGQQLSSSPPYVFGHFVSAAWLAGDGTSTTFDLGSRQAGIGAVGRPSVAAAADRFLVAWADGPVDDATDIRGMRVTSTDGPLDPDGGILLATTTGGAAVIGGPVVAFDGTVWLVAWTEVGVGGNDLRAVAVATDGTVLDATPRLLASGLSAADPAIASAGDGRSLVLYVQPDAGKSAVRAQLVPGS